MRASVVLIAVGIACPAALDAYLTWLPTYDELAKRADAIVVAMPLEREELSAPAVLPGGVERDSEAIAAIEIRTTFMVAAVLGGDALAVGDAFELQHFIEKSPPTGLRGAGPALIDFDPALPRHYLMFVKKRPDGGFEAVNPVEPAWCIEALSHPVERAADSNRSGR